MKCIHSSPGLTLKSCKLICSWSSTVVDIQTYEIGVVINIIGCTIRLMADCEKGILSNKAVGL